MVRVIAVEDREQTVKLFRAYDWAVYNCKFCGIAPSSDAANAAKEMEADIVIIDCDMEGQDTAALASEIRKNRAGTELIFISYHQRFESVQEAIAARASMLVAPFRTAELTDYLVRAVSSFGGRGKEAEQEKGSYLVKRALSYMRENFCKSVTLYGMAEDLGVSVWHLCKTLKQETGKSYMELLNQMKLKRAMELLLETDLKIYEVAERSGFSEVTYFQNFFKRQTGYTPNGYKKMRKTEQ